MCGKQWARGVEGQTHKVDESEATSIVKENSFRHLSLFTRCLLHAGVDRGRRCGKLSCALRHLDKSEEMRVALHLSASELETVIFLPAVVLVGGEELVEL